MAQILELFALVEMTGPAAPKPDPIMDAIGAGHPPAPTIKRIIRTYESDTRANVDVELLQEVAPGPVYAVIAIPHIES